MTLGVFPVPKDVRADRDFQLVMGQDELIRLPMAIDDLTASFDVGEWVKPGTSGGVTKAQKLDSGDDLTTPALGAKACWTLYRPGDSSAGQTDAMATGKIDVLSGTYQAKTKIYKTGSSYSPGQLLAATYDSVNDRGYLDALPTDGTITVVQLQRVVARVIEVASGVLHYESPGL